MIPINMTREEKVQIINRLKTFFEEERSETIGDLAAENLLDFMLKELGPYIYNRAVYDARQLVNQRFAQLEEDLYTLERPLRWR
ncbi:MAG: DUF2164 domain-containing protein [Bacillota bacterium]|jgi:uncharacterized protein (DUF2164 family)|nr:DUF2164 domain-containing protein [Bacillota bacterium]